MNLQENFSILKPKFNNLKEAHVFGKVTKGNSKILGSTFSTDPFQCKVGEKLASVENSTCSKCYARKLAKVYPSARKSWENNLNLFREAEKDSYNLVKWCESIAYQILQISVSKLKAKKQGASLHRWFSSGDLDNLNMLKAIVYICKLTPSVSHWLPTREKALIRQYLNTNLEGFPKNLNVRISDTMIDQVNFNESLAGVTFSSVHTDKVIKGHECKAINNSGSCGSCTMCWDKTVIRVSYKKH